ncbi:YraN family protein [Patescibacteria group bacterium]
MTWKKKIGDYGEKLAMQYLVRNGYIILDRHFSGRFGEIDIIAFKESKIHFVEVKTRTNSDSGLPEEALTKSKMIKLFKTARRYIYIKRIESDNYQLDLVAIELNKNTKIAKIRHYQAIQLNPY